MKMKDRFYSKTIGCIIAMLAIVLGVSSCKDDFTTDNGSFALYYTSMTDIGPSMVGTIASPTYKGAAPYDFKITGITYSCKNEKGEEVTESYSGECFVINTENGEIDINSTRDMKTGKYLISVSCYSAGKMYTFNNAVEVNFLKAVPEGIIVEPNFIEVKWADVKNKESETVFPTAKVTTENSTEHITITGYKISNVVRLESDGSETIISNNKIELFTISDKGIISINKNSEDEYEDVKAGLYRIDLKLTTMASSNLSEEEGLFVDAMRINLSGAPTSISYDEGAIETGVEGNPDKPRGNFKSSKPLIEGSSINAVYEITAIKKVQSPGGTLIDASDEEKAFFSIDGATGEVSVPNTHTFIKGNVYKVYVKVTNPEGDCTSTDENALTLNVVEWVDPLVDFTYTMGNMKQGMSFESAAANYGTDSYVKYSFKSLPQGYEDFFSINEETGVVKIEKYNTLPRTDKEGKPFVVEVKAKNFKDEVTGKLEINVNENPNFFESVSYGNNISEDKTPAGIYDNQFRYREETEMKGIELTPSLIGASDSENLTWKIEKREQVSGVQLDGVTGKLTLPEKMLKLNQTGYLLIKVSKGQEGGEKFERVIPVFFQLSVPKNNVTVEYTPFVLHVNPKKGGRSVTPKISNGNSFLMDYRRNPTYNNINGLRNDGSKLESGIIEKKEKDPDDPDKDIIVAENMFLKHLWENVADFKNYGAKLPISYYTEKNQSKSFLDLKEKTLAYVDNANGENQYSVVVNPNWYDDGWADGVFTAQMTFVTDGNPANLGNSNNQIFPIAIWFDKTYTQK